MAAQRQELLLKTTIWVIGDEVPYPVKTWEHDLPKSWVEKYEPASGFQMMVVREFGKTGRLTLEFEHNRHVLSEYVTRAQGETQDKPPQFWVLLEMPGDNIVPELLQPGDQPIASPRPSILTDAVEGARWSSSLDLPNGWKVTYKHKVFAPLRRQITGPTTVPSRKSERE